MAFYPSFHSGSFGDTTSDMFPQHKPIDREGLAIVVLGGGFSADGTLSRSSYRRAMAAVSLWKERPGPIFFSGGATSRKHGTTEAEAMGALARAAGVNEEHLHFEPNSRDTWENAKHLARLFQIHRIDQALVVTSPEHIFRARLCFRTFGCSPMFYRGPYLEEKVSVRRILFYESGAMLRFIARWMENAVGRRGN